MMAEPLRSALGSSSAEDTSLVLPSDKKLCTGQQRVLQQVNSIKRSKSKMVKSDSVPSPTSPPSAVEHSEPKFQFSPTRLNGTLFRTTMSRQQSRMNGHSLSVRKTVRRQNQSTSQWDSQISVQAASNGVKPSGSDPVLNRAGTLMTKRVGLSRAATVNVQPVSSSQTETKVRSKSETLGMNGGTGALASLTLKEAVEYLKHSDVSYQLRGASFIQHHTFTDDNAKKEVCQLKGIPPLVELLKSDNSQLQQTAAAALRNIVFKDISNKLKVKSCGGLEVILNSLKNTKVSETQKQLTGLLWNLSSADELKSELISSALVPLTDNIVVPYTQGSDSKFIDSEVFYNTTGCIRNLSCAENEQGERTTMRNCAGLIDSLMTYVQSRVDRGDPDDKSVENCVCILHNLSYQLETEAPELFKHLVFDETSEETPSKTNSLFSPKSSRKTKTRKYLGFPEMGQPDPEGVAWLYSVNSLQMYLSLLSSSQTEGTLEACCGALQNLTASKYPVSTLMSETIAKLYGLLIVSPLLNSSNPGLQKTAMSLVGNMSRVSSLRENMAKSVLPHISSVLSSVTPNMSESDNTIATACRVMQTLALSEPELSKKMLNQKLIDSLSQLSSNMSFESARKAAGVLLCSLWLKKDIQNVLKKKGMERDTFINTVTATSYKLATGLNLK